MDTIEIRGLRVWAHHGVFEEEKKNGQRFCLDITLEADLRRAGRTDDLADTVSYADVAELAVSVMQEKSCDLIECAASRVAEAILERFAPVQAVKIRLSKPDAPVALDFDTMAVEITRRREDFPA